MTAIVLRATVALGFVRRMPAQVVCPMAVLAKVIASVAVAVFVKAMAHAALLHPPLPLSRCVRGLGNTVLWVAIVVLGFVSIMPALHVIIIVKARVTIMDLANTMLLKMTLRAYK
jgi:hypothetical protein